MRTTQIPNLKLVFVLLGLITILNCKAQYRIEVLDSNTFKLGDGVVLSKTSFRGLSVVDDNTIWASGSRGTFARSIDGGKTFTYTQLKGYAKSDFRDIEAFDDKRAVMMSSGTPAYILKTIDGGLTWKEVYKNTDTAYFLDAMDFWDEQHGILVGDPINRHFVLLETKDGGNTWQELDTTKTPHAMEGEAVFAASGTSLRCWGKNEFGFVTGGMASRLIHFRQNHDHWGYFNTGILNGQSSQGVFSFAQLTKSKRLFFVGGDYLNDTQTMNPDYSIGYFRNGILEIGINSVDLKNKELYEYKSAIEILSSNKSESQVSLITTGSKGTTILNLLSGHLGFVTTRVQKHNNSFHVVRKAKKGKAVFLAGPKGKIGKLVYE